MTQVEVYDVYKVMYALKRILFLYTYYSPTLDPAECKNKIRIDAINAFNLIGRERIIDHLKKTCEYIIESWTRAALSIAVIVTIMP